MENVITVGIQRQKETDREIHDSMEELRRLTETAGGQVVQSHIQKKDRPDPATFIGKGKVTDVHVDILKYRAQAVIFDNELKPVQQRNLEELLGVKVIDRTRLILDIFAQRARTREGMLQVELAQLDYMLPRMTARFGRFEQQTGGIGTRGPGERKLEVDQRRVRDRIAALKKQIEKISGERELQRHVRRAVPVPQVALVGYTNAGKSTLLNTLLRLSAGAPKAGEHEVYADDKLFATLDPTTRRVRLPGGRIILFSDTVGFIRKLPTQLIASFRATLEEAASADLLLHVVDGSDPAWEDQEKAVLEILQDLKLGTLPRLTAYNKMDRFSGVQKDHLRQGQGVLVSAATGEGLSELLNRVEERLASQWVEKEVVFGFNQGQLLAQLHETADILSQETTDRGIRVRLRTHPATWSQWKKDHDLSQ